MKTILALTALCASIAAAEIGASWKKPVHTDGLYRTPVVGYTPYLDGKPLPMVATTSNRFTVPDNGTFNFQVTASNTKSNGTLQEGLPSEPVEFSLVDGIYFGDVVPPGAPTGVKLAAVIINPHDLHPPTGTSYPAEVLADNPVSYWRLADVSSPAVDVMGTNDATWVGTPTFSEDGAIPGNDSTVNNTNSYAYVDDNASLSITGPLTLEAWVYPTATNALTAGIFGKYQGGAVNQRGYMFYMQNDRKLGAVVSSDGTFAATATATSPDAIPLNSWTHIAAVYTPSTSIIIYTNGVPVITNSTSIPASIFNGTNRFWIGMQFENLGPYRFIGRIDEAAVYNTALPAARINAHYDARSTP